MAARPAPRVMMRDDTLDHQIRIHMLGQTSGLIAVSCLCRYRPQGHSYTPLEARTRWDPEDALAVYRCHLAAMGAT
jgi:hypothetical protein